jgi:hypothetical protein
MIEISSSSAIWSSSGKSIMLAPANNGSKKTETINMIRQIILMFLRIMRSNEYPKQGNDDE